MTISLPPRVVQELVVPYDILSVQPVTPGMSGAEIFRCETTSGHALAMKRWPIETKAARVAEVHRLAPLVEAGGYIGFCDHRVPPDVPLENYWFYLETVRDVWGHGIHLKPMGELEMRQENGHR